MKITQSPLFSVITIEPQPFQDERGEFFRVFCAEELKDYISTPFVQINHSVNRLKGTLRGLHYQQPPFAEGKLIRCVVGSVYDVAVDIRQDSPTFLQHYGVELSAANRKAIYIPPGFAHGFITLEDNTQLIYHHTVYYQPGVEGGFNYADPTLSIDWMIPVTVLSDRDRNLPYISENFKGINI